jgi:hypothetical protein
VRLPRHFDGHNSVKRWIASFPNDAKPAGPNPLDQLESPESTVCSSEVGDGLILGDKAEMDTARRALDIVWDAFLNDLNRAVAKRAADGQVGRA